MNPLGRLYLVTVTLLLPNAAVASASIATTLGRTSDHSVIGGCMGIVCGVLLEERMVMEENVMLMRWALRAVNEER